MRKMRGAIYMMLIRKKWSVPVTLTLAVSLLVSACSSAQPNQSGGDKPGQRAKIAIEIARVHSESLPKDDPITDMINKKFEIDYKVTSYPSNEEYVNLLNVRVASNSAPDVMTLSRDQFREFNKAGLLLDLTPYLDQLNHISDAAKSLGTKNPFLTATIDGKVMAIPKPFRGLNGNTLWMRQDWLDKVKLKVPSNLDELYAVLKAFTTDDPDGNGKKDTYGITGVARMDSFLPIFGAYGVGLPGTFYQKDGKLMSAYYDPGMVDALKYIKKLLDEGLIEPDFMSNTNENRSLEKAYQGKVGALYTHWGTITKTENKNQYLAVNPNAKWVQGGSITGPGGNYNHNYDIGGDSGFLGLSKELEKDPEKIKRILELLNYLSTPEGSNLVMYGIEGRHYNMVDGKVVPTPLLDKEGGYYVVHQILGRKEPEYLYTKFPNDVGHVDHAANLPRIETLNGFVVRPENYNNADALRYADEEYVKFIYGRRPLSEYNDFLRTLETKFNYKLYQDKALSDLKALGIVK
jgi:putative aldouronate transport system substrate-binding protein